MYKKYEWAARYPWLPAAKDEPIPVQVDKKEEGERRRSKMPSS